MMWWVLVLLGCSGSSEEDTDDTPPEPVTVVEITPAFTGSVADRVATTSVVEAERAADIVPVTPGVVLSVHADDGDPVRRGDLLAVLDNVSLAAGADRSRAEVARLEKQLEASRSLAQRGAISSRELEDLEYQLQTARTNAREARRSYGQTRLTAPFDGVVARRDVKVGELATARAFQIVDMSELKVVIDLPERDVGRVAIGQPVRLESAYDAELTGKGMVSRVSPVIDAMTGTFRATVVLEPGSLRPGQFVNAHIEVARHEEIAVVPRKALMWEDGRPVVFVMVDPPPPEEGEDGEPKAEPSAPDGEPGKVAARRPLKVGLIDDVGVEVIEGVDVGEPVIVVGQSNLKDGARVRAVEDRAKVENSDEGDAG